MKAWMSYTCAGLLGLAAISGCRNEPVPRVAPPALGLDTYRQEADYRKPLPPPAEPVNVGPRPFNDDPLLVDQPPEAKAFVDVYNKVGRPRIVVFVNRTLEGSLMPTDDQRPQRIEEHTRRATTGMSMESRDIKVRGDYWTAEGRGRKDSFSTQGAGEYTETRTVYLKPGQYDELSAKAIDYGMMELLLTDWLSTDNQVTIMSPMMAPNKRLTDQQIRDLQEGRPQVLSELAQQLDADILVQVQARPTRQTPQGLELRILAEALNVRGGESLARAAVDLVPPMDKVQLNTYTRFLARKLMDGMVQSWTAPAAPQQSTTQPAR